MRSATATAPAPASTPTPSARDAGLTADRLDQFAALLEEQRSTLLARAARLGVDIEELQTPTATHGQGETELTASNAERAVAEVLEAGTLEALEEIAFALARIDDGSYGICSACGVPIGIERLLAMPETRHCVTCRQARERRGR
jgi:RNA polymerase-binding transcription factor DksA